MNFIIRALNLYLYSSLHIGLGALALTYLSFSAFRIPVDRTYLLFVFSSTVFLYCLHRFIGIKKLISFEQKGRFEVIYRYRNHILVYALLSAIAASYCVLQFDTYLIKLLVIPSVISILYTLPVLGRGKRLRDYGYIKIFLIAIVWSWITVWIPLHYFADMPATPSLVLLSVERFLFFIAITIPFDIRDQHIDKRTDLKTMIHLIDAALARRLCYLLLFVAMTILVFLTFNYQLGGYYTLAHIITYLITCIIIYLSTDKEHDYYYTGLLDGMMLLPILFYTLLGTLA